MIEGVVPFPPEFAQRYREKGYWRDLSLREEFDVALRKFAPRVLMVDGERHYTYAEVDRLSGRLALNLLALGLRPLDAVVLTLPNVAEFVILYFALQKLGAIPIAALATHRYAEVSQFVRIAGAAACVYPEAQGDFRFAPTIRRVQEELPCMKFPIVLGNAGPGEHSLTALIEQEASLPGSALERIVLDPADPCIYQLSGGTTGIPKLIPRTHNDYAYNSRTAAPVCGVTADSVLLLVIPIAHNLALACPGIQGYAFTGGKVVVSASARPQDMFALIQKHRVTHIKVVPALLIRLISSPEIGNYDLSSLKVIQSGGQRMQPEVRLRTKQLIPGVTVQENFGMSEGMLFFVRLDDPDEVMLETCGRPISPDDEVRLVDDEGREVAPGEAGELTCRGAYTLRGYLRVPEYNAKQFTPDGFYRSGDLMRLHPSGNYVVEGRRKDLINRGGEKISAEEIENLILMHPAVQDVACVAMPDAKLGEKTCACVIPRAGRTLTLKELVEFLATKEIARFKLPERLELMNEFPSSTFGKVSKKSLVEMVSNKLEKERA
ncbi:MAG: AMP-binding protein [Betaproteobacteria bacterium]|nr:AMP-binding protein [Betaproteobacteria bacterium]